MQLIICAAGDHQGKVFSELLGLIKECSCNIQESRMSMMGGHCMGLLVVQGNWNHVAKLENLLSAYQQRTGFHVYYKRLGGEGGSGKEDALLYVTEAVAKDQPGILGDLVDFFVSQGVGIQDLRSSCYQVPYVKSAVSTIHMLLKIPNDISVITLRDDYLEYCEKLYVDAILEPVKPIV